MKNRSKRLLHIGITLGGRGKGSFAGKLVGGIEILLSPLRVFFNEGEGEKSVPNGKKDK